MSLFSQTPLTHLMAVPPEFHEAVTKGLVELNSGVLRYVGGSNPGAIASHLIPVGEADAAASMGSRLVAGFVPVMATQFVIVGAVSATFYHLNNKLNDLCISFRKLESKVDDTQWSRLAGALDQLRRVEDAGRDSSIWGDLRGVRRSLSEAAAYHALRFERLREELSPKSRSDYKQFPEISREGAGEVIASLIARGSLGRALLLEGAFEQAKNEMEEARREASSSIELLSSGLLHYVVKKQEKIFKSKSFQNLQEEIHRRKDAHGSTRSLGLLVNDLRRQESWADGELIKDMRAKWKEEELFLDVDFLLHSEAEAVSKSISYNLCAKNRLDHEAFKAHVKSLAIRSTEDQDNSSPK